MSPQQVERIKGYNDVYWGREPLNYPALQNLSGNTLESYDGPSKVEIDPTLVEHALYALSCYSRTFQGVGSNETSNEKLEILTQGDALVEQASQNFRRGVQYFYEALAFGVFHKSDRAMAYLSAAPTIFNHGIIQLEQGPFRTWETPHNHVPAECIASELTNFARSFAQLLSAPAIKPARLAAWIEHDLNGRIHPYSDGCGRISRGLSTAYLALYDIARPVFASREEYIAGFASEFDIWAELFEARIPKN